MLSFYDWYADLPVASPQVFGDQTDVPESGDWWDASYLIMWGSNVPVTRTPDAHWMAEARYRGQKVVVVSPDYADNAKFADEWLPAQPGTDGALAMAMGHVDPQGVLRRPAAPRASSTTCSRYTDLPFLVTLRERDGRVRARQVPHRGGPRRTRGEERRVQDGAAGRGDRRPAVPQRLAGLPLHRVRRGPLEPRPRRRRARADAARRATAPSRRRCDLPRFDTAGGAGGVLRRGRAGPRRSAAGS